MRQALHLVLDLGAAQAVAGVALGLVDAAGQRAAIGRVHADLADPARGVGGVDLVVERHRHLLAEGRDLGREKVAVELAQARAAVHGDEAQHRAHRELALVHRGGHRHAAQHVDGALVHVGRDLGNIRRLELVLFHHLQQRVGGRVRVAAGGVVLERGLGQRPARAQAVGELGGIGVARHAHAQPLRAFEDLRRAREAVLREVGRHQPAGRRVRAVQLLRIGRVAQELPHTGRLRAGRAEGMQHLLRRQLEQAAHRRGCRERARRRRGVEGAVVRPAQELADADAHLVARDHGRQQLRAAGAEALCHRQCGCDDHGGRVEHRAVVHVVLLHVVRGRRVDHRREQRRAGAPRGEDLARPVGGAHHLREALDAAYRPRGAGREHRAEPVEHQVLGAAQHGRGDVGELQLGREGREHLAGVVDGVHVQSFRTSGAGRACAPPRSSG
ncbi:hypothetical protein D3C71_612070 [compost metagenome]